MFVYFLLMNHKKAQGTEVEDNVYTEVGLL